MTSLYLDNSLEWPSVYSNRIKQLGNTATLFNFGDIGNFGALNAATGVGMKFNASGLSPTWTWQDAGGPIAFATPFDLTLESNWQGSAPVLTFNGIDEEADSPDATYWTRLDSSAEPFTIGLWVHPTKTSGGDLFGKWTTAGGQREWIVFAGSDERYHFKLFDDTNNVEIEIKNDTAYALNTWHFLTCTYSGNASPTGQTIYMDGAADSDVDSDDVSYVTMVNTPSVVSIAAFPQNVEGEWGGSIAGGPYCPFFVQAELTAEQIANLYAIERQGMGL